MKDLLNNNTVGTRTSEQFRLLFNDMISAMQKLVDSTVYKSPFIVVC